MRSTRRSSVTLPWTNVAAEGTFSRNPPLRSSRMVTWWPRPIRASATWEPMNSAPPVTRTRLIGWARESYDALRFFAQLAAPLTVFAAAAAFFKSSRAHAESLINDTRRRRSRGTSRLRSGQNPTDTLPRRASASRHPTRFDALRCSASVGRTGTASLPRFPR
jgi:hypothetical protein